MYGFNTDEHHIWVSAFPISGVGGLYFARIAIARAHTEWKRFNILVRRRRDCLSFVHVQTIRKTRAQSIRTRRILVQTSRACSVVKIKNSFYSIFNISELKRKKNPYVTPKNYVKYGFRTFTKSVTKMFNIIRPATNRARERSEFECRALLCSRGRENRHKARIVYVANFQVKLYTINVGNNLH